MAWTVIRRLLCYWTVEMTPLPAELDELNLDPKLLAL